MNKYAYRSSLDGSVLEDDFDEEPLEDGFGCYGDFQLVGQGEATSDSCGKFSSYKGCLRVDLHDKVDLNGVNYSGKVFVRKVRFSCGKPSCPICFKRGWAIRQAGKIKARLDESGKRFGVVEHIVASVPVKDYGLSLEDLRKRTIKALKVRGVVGGVLIFHAFRYNLVNHWYWSPHFHVLGFVLGGFARCRHCVKLNTLFCLGCDGFEARTRREFEKDGYIVKVLGKRKTVFGTVWYQLHHASIKKGVTRFHVSTWFGTCSYRKLKVTVEVKKDLCPICQHDLVNIRYFGVKSFVLDSGSSDYRRDSFEDYEEDGHAVWVEFIKH